MHEWVWVQEGSFLRCLYPWGASPGVACWAATNLWEVQPPFFAIPSFKFKPVFLAVFPRSFGQSFTRWSGLSHPKQLWFFLRYSSTALANQLIYFTWQSCVLFSRGLSLFFPIRFWAWVFLNFMTFYCSRSGCECVATLQLPGWK